MGISDEICYDPSLGINIIPHFLAQDQCLRENLSRSQKHLRLPSRKILDCLGILRAIPVKIDDPKFFLDFHIFDLPRLSSHLIFIGRPITTILEQVPGHKQLELKVGNDHLPLWCSQSHIKQVQSEPKFDPKEVMSISLVDIAQSCFDEELIQF